MEHSSVENMCGSTLRNLVAVLAMSRGFVVEAVNDVLRGLIFGSQPPLSRGWLPKANLDDFHYFVLCGTEVGSNVAV